MFEGFNLAPGQMQNAQVQVMQVRKTAAPGKTMRAPVFVSAFLDTSGSMAGGKLEAAERGMVDMVEALLKHQKQGKVNAPGDLIMLHTFDRELKCKFNPLAPSRVMTGRGFDVKAGRTTALYDAIVKGAGGFKQGARRAPIMMLLTDGSDTSSCHSEEDAEMALIGACEANPDLLVVFLSVGTEGLATLKRMRRHVKSAGAHCSLLEVENTGRAILKAFQWVVQEVQSHAVNITMIRVQY